MAPYNLSWCFFLIYILTSFRSPIKELYYSSTLAAHQSESEAPVYTNIWNEEKEGSSGLFFLLNNCDSKRLNVHLG